MTVPEIWIRHYILIFGSLLVLVGLMEMLMPRRAFQFWKMWAKNRFFFLHGLFLMASGFPLVMYTGYYETAVFVIGLFVVFSGPFVLLFPEKFQKTFENAEEELGEKSTGRIIYFEAAMRIAAGLLCLAAFFQV